MFSPQMVVYEEEITRIQSVVDRLLRDAHARLVFVVDKSGQLLANAGDTQQMDTTSLASLMAGNVAATGGIANLLRENEFTTQFHEGKRSNIHIQVVGNRGILVVIFDNKSSLGLVRLRVRKAAQVLDTIFIDLHRKSESHTRPSPFAEITDEDIDNLFSD